MSQTDNNYGDNIANQITHINELLTLARKKGIQMKQLAEVINISPSVLSAFYRTVVPAFIEKSDKMETEDALDYAFSLVNNISKTRFLPFLPNIILAVKNALENKSTSAKEDDKKHFDNFVQTVTSSQVSIQHIEGIYKTYSISSSDFSLKCEPMIISRSSSGMIKVLRLSIHNILQEGFGMVADHQSLTVHLNEASYPKYYPLTMQVNIPLCFNPKIYRGIYITLDSQSHPIARRVILERISESTLLADFQTDKAEQYSSDNIPVHLNDYFDYLKEPRDILRVTVVPEPTADTKDLKIEKKILKLYENL